MLLARPWNDTHALVQGPTKDNLRSTSGVLGGEVDYDR